MKLQNIKEEFSNIFKYVKQDLFLIGIIGVFGFPLYYFIWQYIYPQSYESLGLRLVCSALFLPWLFYNKLPSNLVRIFPVYFFFSLFIAIPLFFTYMLFANNFSDVWLMSYLAAIYLAILLLYHWWLIIIMFFFAIVINLIFYPFNDITTTSFEGFDNKYIPIYLFALLICGITCHKLQNTRQSKIQNLKSFGGGIAHEMRNPLNAINLLTARIRNLILTNDNNIKKQLEFNDIEEINKNLNIILGCTTRASEVIDMILANLKEKVRQKKLEFLSTSDLLSSAIKEYGFDHESQREKVILNTKDNFIIKADKTSFTYVIFNLLKNSLYYLKSHPNEYVKIYVKIGLENSKYNQLIVEDNGPGIPADKIKRIFDSFYTSGKKEGTGLGLDFCKKTMDSFEGKIECESEVGKFTRFILSFPKLSESELTKLLPNGKKTKFDHLSKNILVLERSKILEKSPDFTKNILGLKINANFFSKEKNIISELKSHYNYDLLLIDANNDSVSDLISKIRKFHDEIPIVVYNAKRSDEKNLVNVGVDEIIYESTKQSLLISRSIAKWNIINKLPGNFSNLQESDNKKIKILLADDEPVNRMILSKVLQRYGFEIEEVVNGQELHDKVFADDSNYDIIISDINMPIMNGDEAVKNIRKSSKQVPVIVYSGDGEKEKIHKFLRAGMNDFFVKGGDIEYLSNLIKFWTSSI
jgi:two-component system CAI-1 autoinducer sensor kinase/phosphatase CqsS